MVKSFLWSPAIQDAPAHNVVAGFSFGGCNGITPET